VTRPHCADAAPTTGQADEAGQPSQSSQAGQPSQSSQVGQGSQAGRAAGRRAGDSGTREMILDAARHRFAEHGYDGATIRSIAADASVDPALVHHFFGSKEQLFVAAMRLPFAPGEMILAALAPGARAPGVSAGEQLIRTALRAWDDPAVRRTFLGLLRSALTSEQAARMLREFISETILGPVAQAARADGAAEAGNGADAGGGELAGADGVAGSGAGAAGGNADAEYRAAMIASQVLGLAVTRFVLALGPVAAASPDDLAATIGPTLQRYLTGEIRAADQGTADPPGWPGIRLAGSDPAG
jgi:AcrR family transcriptional regulator